MLKQVFTFFLSSILSCINLFKHFILDSSSGITLFHFFIFLIFSTITLRLINFLKSIQEVDQDNNFNKLKNERGFKK